MQLGHLFWVIALVVEHPDARIRVLAILTRVPPSMTALVFISIWWIALVNASTMPMGMACAMRMKFWGVWSQMHAISMQTQPTTMAPVSSMTIVAFVEATDRHARRVRKRCLLMSMRWQVGNRRDLQTAWGCFLATAR